MSKDFKYGQIHLIPFDIGYMFYDVLSESNDKNIEFGNKFIERLEQAGFEPQTNNHSYHIDTSSREKELFCTIKLSDNLYCHISRDGIATFVLADFEQRALDSYKKGSENCPLPVLMSVQKKITNQALMSTKVDENGKPVMDPNFKNVLFKERKQMHDFQNTCWQIAKEIATSKEFDFKCVRPYTSNANFKNYGFSYSMNIMIGNNLSEEHIKYILYGGAPKLNFNDNYWVKSLNHFNEVRSGCMHNDVNKVYAGPHEMYFSWSSIVVNTVIPGKEITTFDRFLYDEQECETLLSAELAIQSRWFNADNCIDNSIENQYSKIENLQKLQGYIEYCSAQLENPTSSSTSSLYLKIQAEIIKTSKIQALYKSIIDRMRAQKEIKLEIIRKKSNKLMLATDILLGIFTAAGVFKTIWDIATKDFKWWSLLILGAVIALFVGIQIWIYFAKKIGKK